MEGTMRQRNGWFLVFWFAVVFARHYGNFPLSVGWIHISTDFVFTGCFGWLCFEKGFGHE